MICRSWLRGLRVQLSVQVKLLTDVIEQTVDMFAGFGRTLENRSHAALVSEVKQLLVS